MPERVLWNLLRNRRCAGLKFRRQHPIGPYTADFYCDEAKLVVELDSEWHDGQEAQDAARDAWLSKQGVATMRISVSSLMKDAGWVAGLITAAAGRRIEEFASGSSGEVEGSERKKREAM